MSTCYYYREEGKMCVHYNSNEIFFKNFNTNFIHMLPGDLVM